MDVPILLDSTGRFCVLYYSDTDGAGLAARREFSRLIQRHGLKSFYHTAHEWCAGHGAIGFQLLEDGLCEQLVLSDVHAPAIQSCRFTIALNQLQSRTRTHVITEFGDLPDQKWDLMVANPPWRSVYYTGADWPNLPASEQRNMFDIGYSAHNDMWRNIARYLNPDAEIFLYEDSRFSSRETWHQQIQQAGLVVLDEYHHFNLTTNSTGYVLHLKNKGSK